MALADRNRELAALMAYCEASNGTQYERRRVIATSFNRTLNPVRFEPTVAGAVLQRMQFSEFNADKIDNANLERGANAQNGDLIFQDCYAAYDEVLAGGLSGPFRAGFATHYEDAGMVPSDWTVGATLVEATQHFKFYSNVK